MVLAMRSLQKVQCCNLLCFHFSIHLCCYVYKCHVTHTHRLPLSLFFWFPFLHSSNLRIQEQNDLSWASGLELQACFSYPPGIPGAGRCWFGASWVMYPGAPSKLPQSQNHVTCNRDPIMAVYMELRTCCKNKGPGSLASKKRREVC